MRMRPGRRRTTLALLVLPISLALPTRARARTVATVRMVMSADGGKVYFDPIGLHIQPGDTVRWIEVRGYHSSTAYHPANGNHELRIPDGAESWDSDVLLAQYPAKGSAFEHTFPVPGVYDYFCKPHEAAGMVGRIVVGEPGSGPGTRPFGYAPERHWRPVPLAAQRRFPPIERIMAEGVVRLDEGAR